MDDADGFLTQSFGGCDEFISRRPELGCDFDLHSIMTETIIPQAWKDGFNSIPSWAANIKKGTFVKDVCPVSCNACGTRLSFITKCLTDVAFVISSTGVDLPNFVDLPNGVDRPDSIDQYLNRIGVDTVCGFNAINGFDAIISTASCGGLDHTARRAAAAALFDGVLGSLATFDDVLASAKMVVDSCTEKKEKQFRGLAVAQDLVCCQAITATCLACQKGMSVRDFCDAEKASGATFGASGTNVVAALPTGTATTAADSNSKKNTKIALGVGIGLGFLFLLSVAAYDIAHGATCFGAFPSVAAPTSHPGAAAPVSFVATENSLRGH